MASSSIHREGLNCFASAPHRTLERLIDKTGAVTTVPQGIERWVTGVGENRVTMGLPRGIMSSSVAYSRERGESIQLIRIGGDILCVKFLRVRHANVMFRALPHRGMEARLSIVPMLDLR